MTLGQFSDVLGAIAAAIASWQALRASTIYRRAHGARHRSDSVKGSRIGNLFMSAADRFDTNAGWRPRDHALLVLSIAALALSYVIAFISSI